MINLLSSFLAQKIKFWVFLGQKIGNLSSGLGVYTWEWNDIAKQMNISDTTTGVLAQEVLEYAPSLVTMTSSGYLKVNYEGLI